MLRDYVNKDFKIFYSFNIERSETSTKNILLFKADGKKCGKVVAEFFF